MGEDELTKQERGLEKRLKRESLMAWLHHQSHVVGQEFDDIKVSVGAYLDSTEVIFTLFIEEAPPDAGE